MLREEQIEQLRPSLGRIHDVALWSGRAGEKFRSATQNGLLESCGMQTVKNQ